MRSVPLAKASAFPNEAALWLWLCGGSCFSPDDDYDQQEQDFDDSISRLLLDLRGELLSTDCNFQELKTVIDKLISTNSGKNQKNSSTATHIPSIDFLQYIDENKLNVKLENRLEILLKVVTHIYTT